MKLGVSDVLVKQLGTYEPDASLIGCIQCLAFNRTTYSLVSGGQRAHELISFQAKCRRHLVELGVAQTIMKNLDSIGDTLLHYQCITCLTFLYLDGMTASLVSCEVFLNTRSEPSSGE